MLLVSNSDPIGHKKILGNIFEKLFLFTNHYCTKDHGMTSEKWSQCSKERLASGLHWSSDLVKFQTTMSLVQSPDNPEGWSLPEVIQFKCHWDLERLDEGKSYESACFNLQPITPSSLRPLIRRHATSQLTPSHMHTLPRSPITRQGRFLKNLTQREQ